MATAEGTFPKVGGDPVYVSELNPFFTSGVTGTVGSRLLIQYGKFNASDNSTTWVVFDEPYDTAPIVTIGNPSVLATNIFGVGGLGLGTVGTGSFGYVVPALGGAVNNVNYMAIGPA